MLNVDSEVLMTIKLQLGVTNLEKLLCCLTHYVISVNTKNFNLLTFLTKFKLLLSSLIHSKFCITLTFYNYFVQFAQNNLASISTCFAFWVTFCSCSVSSTKLSSSVCRFSVCRWSSPLLWHNVFTVICSIFNLLIYYFQSKTKHKSTVISNWYIQ